MISSHSVELISFFRTSFRWIADTHVKAKIIEIVVGYRIPFVSKEIGFNLLSANLCMWFPSGIRVEIIVHSSCLFLLYSLNSYIEVSSRSQRREIFEDSTLRDQSWILCDLKTECSTSTGYKTPLLSKTLIDKSVGRFQWISKSFSTSTYS